ncbi:hypothetical protein [Mesobacillus maritimus]|uniref:Replication protein n=1 Tax=Mesobacillus maritimus TaxID=1643336 RepID=A0ABS7K5C2_9BACI|nr:hypothetical protein [Mesobacillus maritimus]MBY0097310.1 hypothetical protein [Mesobacillus maritimus]
MTGIIKRRKTTNFAQIHNHVLQSISDIRAIGLIAHLMSMPTEWVIRKTHLYSKFGRAPVTNGIGVLEEHKYWVHITFRDGSKNIHAYHISDVPFTDSEVTLMIKELCEAGFRVNNISEHFLHLLPGKRTENVCTSSNVDSQQSNLNNSSSTVENEQLLNTEPQRKSKQINKNQRNIVNLQQTSAFLEGDDFKQALTAACHELYSKFAPGRWSKQAWQTLIESFVEETVKTGRFKNIPVDNIPSYAHAAISNMVHSFDCKNGRKKMYKIIPTRPVPFYNWVEGTSEEEEPIRT